MSSSVACHHQSWPGPDRRCGSRLALPHWARDRQFAPFWAAHRTTHTAHAREATRSHIRTTRNVPH
eukprot:3442625-Prymnesium_polylepis.1